MSTTATVVSQCSAHREPEIGRHGVGVGLGVRTAGFEAVSGGRASRDGVAEDALTGLNYEVAECRQGEELAIREEIRPAPSVRKF